ncbi:hypothetical protein GUITHDRAFT_120218 [Guillardia theta CCMP2712]|uniref:Rad60/SUMO-like domain-containing protein n=1 Tax=Guillardia theta (strain CCMP2712) TaxID=905079 RepID=L1ICC3_GUITC|nr:hypothetical protein GUITHDRAFT_120218 [Guillardia theta CCMP2712]EKX33579.1 hypothetical protein GUITHDRAFT_120218 [Guillardia theta CCMP2712]|eukprot:XP_005820559.1 hypothetical protein GUITHDRAFT_120218 [Guillardia theta CCMP2712]
MADCYARNAQRLDAEYDAGDSEFVLDSDNDDDFEGPTVTKMSRKSKAGRKMDSKKKQKTPSAAINQYAEEGKDDDLQAPTVTISDSDSAEDEMARLAANFMTRKNHREDERLKIIDDLLMETKRIQEGLLSAASADISAADETQEDDSECQITESTRGMDLDLNPHEKEHPSGVHVKESKETNGPKCIVCIKAREGDKVRKFKISMNDSMNKVFEAFCKSESVAQTTVKFIFDGQLIPWTSTPTSLDMEEESENLVDARIS